MRWTPQFSRYLARLVVTEWENSDGVEFKSSAENISKAVQNLLNQDIEKEKNLDKEVYALMDHLEKSQSESFERYKMFPLLKKKLAEKKGIIL